MSELQSSNTGSEEVLRLRKSSEHGDDTSQGSISVTPSGPKSSTALGMTDTPPGNKEGIELLYRRMPSQVSTATTDSGLLAGTKDGGSDEDSLGSESKAPLADPMDRPNMAAQEDTDSDEEIGIQTTPLELNKDGFPSVGSSLHPTGECTRCCFFFKGRCRNGLNCQFCHLTHEKRSRGRGCRGHGTTRKAAAAAAAAAAASANDAAQPKASSLPQGRLPPGLDAAPVASPPGLPGPAVPKAATGTFLSTTPSCGPLSKPIPENRQELLKAGLASSPAKTSMPVLRTGQLKTVIPFAAATDLSKVNVTLPNGPLIRSKLLATPAPAEATTRSDAADPAAVQASTASSVTTPDAPAAKACIFGTTPVQQPLPRLLGFGRMCSPTGSQLKQDTPPAAAASPSEHSLHDTPGTPAASVRQQLADSVGKVLSATAKDSGILTKKVHCESASAEFVEPAKVTVPDYLSTLPALDPTVPVKKRLPDWTR